MNTEYQNQFPTVNEPYPHKVMSVKEFATLIGEDDVVAVSAFLKLLAGKNVIDKAGNKPAEGGRGKPAQLFKIPNTLELTFWGENDNIEVAEATTENNPVTTPIV